YHFCDAISL
ncbi:Peptide chain release factor 3, partial [Haemophilus influenzae]